MPACLDHPIEREVAYRVEISLKAGGHEVGLQILRQESMGDIQVVVENIPITILAKQESGDPRNGDKSDESKGQRIAWGKEKGLHEFTFEMELRQ